MTTPASSRELVERAIALLERTPIGDLGSNIRPRLSYEQKQQEATAVIAGLRSLAAMPSPVSQSDVEQYPLKACIWKREGEWREREEWVLEISGELNDCSFVCRHTEPLTTPLEDVAGLPSLYAAMPEPSVVEALNYAYANGFRWPERFNINDQLRARAAQEKQG